MAETTTPRPRARHDAGRPPVPWRRTLLLVGSLGSTIGLTVAGAGMLRYGPLARIGWSEQVLAPDRVLSAGPVRQATELDVGVRWDRPESCQLELSVAFAESADRVVIQQVPSRVPRFAILTRGCAEQPTRAGRRYAHLRLAHPLQDRQVVTAAGRTITVSPG